MRFRAFLATAGAVVVWPFVAVPAQVTVAPRPPAPPGAQVPADTPASRSQVTAAEVVDHDSLTIGGRVVPAGRTERGPIVVAGGNIEVRGTVEGSVFAIAGDVVVREGGRVSGDAIAAFGDVTNEGTIGGTAKAFTGTFGASLRALLGSGDGKARPASSPMKLALGWLTVMMLIGLGVLVFASPYLAGVVDVLGQSFWRSFLTGLLGELGILPAILLMCIGLAITVIGVLLIPFAVVAIVLAVAGLSTLGFVAVARLTGDGLGGGSSSRLSERGGALRGVVLGLALYMGLWLVAAALAGTPVAGTILRVLAAIVTFVAATAGFGAALLSRGGTRRDATVVAAPAPAMDSGWQTPTPVAGVVAARRPSRPKAEASSGR